MTIRRAQVFHTRTADFGHVQKQSFSNSFRAGFKPVVEVPRGFGMDMRSLQVLRPNADEPTSMKAGGFNTAGEAPFEIRGFSLGNAILGIGSLILAASFSTFFKGDASGGSGIGFVYGVPIMLIGFALKYAELEPVPLISDMEASSIFEAKASENLKKMKNDVTRHRYGDEAHMDTALKALGLWVPGKAPPELIRIKEQAQAGEMAMTLYFDAKGTPLEMWTDPLMKLRLEKFFGPGISAAVEPMDSEDKEIITVTFRSGATEGQEVKNEVKQVDDGSVISVNLAEKPLGAVISEADTLVKSVNAKAESLGIKPGMRIQAINGYKVTKLNWLQAYKVLDPPLVIDFWVPEELREPVAKANAEAL
eukprot:CAMPEP_0114514806 /NCGR_PEP_ID=MMETSP0109-20121206/16363_1 /TAXON_ID=29199 /ORGANISM="Chlorarachnion reptans, Strain CCCM449" /LENGTH=363 /DNA_ID=CAMNT_0001694897 /DNA_START=408 /DNA_END=1499 /DNA_ORIENTATION=-